MQMTISGTPSIACQPLTKLVIARGERSPKLSPSPDLTTKPARRSRAGDGQEVLTVTSHSISGMIVV